MGCTTGDMEGCNAILMSGLCWLVEDVRLVRGGWFPLHLFRTLVLQYTFMYVDTSFVFSFARSVIRGNLHHHASTRP